MRGLAEAGQQPKGAGGHGHARVWHTLHWDKAALGEADLLLGNGSSHPSLGLRELEPFACF